MSVPPFFPDDIFKRQRDELQILHQVAVIFVEVTNEDELMKGMISTMKLSHFIEFNPAYAWIDSLDHQPENVITGEWGTGETAGKHFKGFYKVK